VCIKVSGSAVRSWGFHSGQALFIHRQCVQANSTDGWGFLIDERGETAMAALFSAFTTRSIAPSFSLVQLKIRRISVPPLKRKRDLKCCCCRYEGREYEKYLNHSIEFVSSWVMCVRHPRGEFRHILFGSSERFQPLHCVLVPTPVRLKREEKNKQN
jgi:hypothetical protein